MLFTVIWEWFALKAKTIKTHLSFPFSQLFSWACLTLTYPRHTDAHQLIFSLHPPIPSRHPHLYFLPHILPSSHIHTYCIQQLFLLRRYTRPDSPPAVTGSWHFLMDVEAAARVLPLPSSLGAPHLPHSSPSPRQPSQASCAEILYNLRLSACPFYFGLPASCFHSPPLPPLPSIGPGRYRASSAQHKHILMSVRAHTQCWQKATAAWLWSLACDREWRKAACLHPYLYISLKQNVNMAIMWVCALKACTRVKSSPPDGREKLQHHWNEMRRGARPESRLWMCVFCVNVPKWFSEGQYLFINQDVVLVCSKKVDAFKHLLKVAASLNLPQHQHSFIHSIFIELIMQNFILPSVNRSLNVHRSGKSSFTHPPFSSLQLLQTLTLTQSDCQSEYSNWIESNRREV